MGQKLRVCALFFNEIVAYVDFVVFDSAGGGGALAGGVADAGEGAGLAEVEDEAVRVWGLGVAPLGVPEVDDLAVDGVFGGAVFFVALFAIDVGDGPAFVGDGFAGVIEEVEFGDGGEGFAVVGA